MAYIFLLTDPAHVEDEPEKRINKKINTWESVEGQAEAPAQSKPIGGIATDI